MVDNLTVIKYNLLSEFAKILAKLSIFCYKYKVQTGRQGQKNCHNVLFAGIVSMPQILVRAGK